MEDFYDVYRPESYEYLLSDPEEDEPAPEPEPEAPEEEPSEPEPEAPEEEPSEPEPEAPEEEPSEPEPEAPEEEPSEPEPEELPVEGEGGGAGGGSGGEVQVAESASVDLTPVVRVLERTNELLEQQEEILVTQHNDLLQLQANVDFVFLAVAALIGVVLGVVVGRVFHDLWRA